MNILSMENVLPSSLVAMVCQRSGLGFCSCDTTKQYSALWYVLHFTLSGAMCFEKLNHPFTLGEIFSQSLAVQVMSNWGVEG